MERTELDADRVASLGDRAVAIAAFLAIIATGLFGAEPERDAKPVSAASAAHGAQR